MKVAALVLATCSSTFLLCQGFLLPHATRATGCDKGRLRLGKPDTDENVVDSWWRRAYLSIGAGSIAATLFPAVTPAQQGDMYSPKFVQEYEDFAKTEGGWSYRDVKQGKGERSVQKGDRVVYDWSGYTIGYFGRPFQAKGGPQGGAFDKDLDFERTVVGSNTVVRGLDEAFLNMKPGGVRQVVVPYGALSYPRDDPTHDRVGPKPSTFSGQRALNFVLDNPRVDRTLLFNVKIVRIDRPNGNGGFVRG